MPSNTFYDMGQKSLGLEHFNEEDLALIAPNHMGDVMSCTETSIFIEGEYTPLERIVLTANGNLQRVLSAFYNSPITVDILKNIPREIELSTYSKDKRVVYDREVNLLCDDKVVCNAKSMITIYKREYLRLIQNEGVGVGQLFRYLNILPEFKLLRIGRLSDTRLFRSYVLKSDGAHCLITEIFSPNLFDC